MIIPFSGMLEYFLDRTWLRINPRHSEYVFSFEEYVKCFLHTPLSAEITARDLFDYLGALKYLNGNVTYRSECSAVLRYFYEDMFSLLVAYIECGADHRITVRIDSAKLVGFPIESVSLQKCLNELRRVLNSDDQTMSSRYKYKLINTVDLKILSEVLTKSETGLAYIMGYLSEVDSSVLEVTD